MSQQPGGPPAGRAPGVAQVSALAVPAAERGVTGRFVAVGVILVALAAAGAVFVGGRIHRNVTESFSVLYEAWQQQDEELEQAHARLQALQRQLTEWGALDSTGAPDGVVVIAREQARDVVQQLAAAASALDSMRSVVSQRQAIIGRASQTLAQETRASLWAVAAGLLWFALIGGWWLARSSARPLAGLRRQLQLADQGQQALATALGPWFGRLSEALAERAAEGEGYAQALRALEARTDSVSAAAQRVRQEAESLARGAEEFRALAERIREFGGESKVLALSAAIESARMEAQGRGVGVVAEELRRVAAEAKETVRHLSELENRLGQAAQAASRAASEAAEEVAAARREALVVQEQARRLAEHLKDLQRRTRQAAQAAVAWSSRGASGRSSLELRASVERALSGGSGSSESAGADAVEARAPQAPPPGDEAGRARSVPVAQGQAPAEAAAGREGT